MQPPHDPNGEEPVWQLPDYVNLSPEDPRGDAFERLWELAGQLDAESREALADAISLGEPLTQDAIADLMEQISPEDRADFRDALEEELGYGDNT